MRDGISHLEKLFALMSSEDGQCVVSHNMHFKDVHRDIIIEEIFMHKKVIIQIIKSYCCHKAVQSPASIL